MWSVTSPTLYPLDESCCCHVDLEAQHAIDMVLSWGESESHLLPPGQLMEDQLLAQPVHTIHTGNQSSACFCQEGG